MKTVSLLWGFMRGNRFIYFMAVASIALASIFSLLTPLVIRVTIDSIIGEEPFAVPGRVMMLIESFGGREGLKERLWLVGFILLFTTAFGGLFLFLRGKWSAAASELAAKTMRDRLYHHLQHLPYSYHVQAETGDLIQRATSDIETVRRFLAVQLVEVGRAAFMISTATYIMLTLDLQMTLVAMTVIPVIFVFSLIFFRRVKTSFRQADEAEGRLSTVLQENLTANQVVRAFARQPCEVDKFDQKNSEYRSLVYRLIRLLAWYWSLSDFLCLLQIAAVLIVGVHWTVAGRLTLGTLVVFLTYTGMLLWPVRQLGRILTDMGRATVALQRIQEVLQVAPEPGITGSLKPDLTGEIQVCGLTFAYGSELPVLRDISFLVKPGQTVALVGPTGGGKSTLVHLLCGLHDYAQGSITINGCEVKDIDKKWLRRHIGLVLQEPFLFARSVRENIRLPRPDASERDVREVAKTVYIDQEISCFEDGYDTLVGERGISLSGGQKQRMAMARTLIRDCPILIFDDSLSAIDTETEAAIREALASAGRDQTLFLISHRASTVADADLILVLEDGRLTQQGTHSDLIAQKGYYRRLWEIQGLAQGMEI